MNYITLKKISTVLVLAVGLAGLQAQNAVPATGGNASGSSGSVNYTVGQVVYNTNTGTGGSVSQGVQQPYQISVENGIEEALGISLEIMIYPNPTIDFIKLKTENYEIKHLRYQLFDTNGSLLKDNKVEGDETSIEMNNLVPATYFLKVMDKNKTIKTFKIIKN